MEKFERQDYTIKSAKPIPRKWYEKLLRFKTKCASPTVISLITPEEFLTLKDGTRLHDIHGYTFIKGSEPINMRDTRHGFIAFGFLKE